MLINVKTILHTPGAHIDFQFEMDLSDVEFAGRYPINRPVIVEGEVRNRADVLYLEGRHTESQSPERYIGLWQSVNDVRVQAGEERFARFIAHIEEVTRETPVIEAEYLTRAWIARNQTAHPLRE